VCRARVVTALDSTGQARIIKSNFEHNHKRKFPHSSDTLAQHLSIIEGAASARLIKKEKGKGRLQPMAAEK